MVAPIMHTSHGNKFRLHHRHYASQHFLFHLNTYSWEVLQDVFKAEGMCHSHNALNTQQQGRSLQVTNKDKPEA